MLIFSRYLTPLVYPRDTLNSLQGEQLLIEKKCLLISTQQPERILWSMGKQDLMVRLNCPHHHSQKKPSLGAKALQHSCQGKTRNLLHLVFKLNLRLGHPLWLARLDTCWLDRKKRYALRETNKRFLSCSKSKQTAFSTLL